MNCLFVFIMFLGPFSTSNLVQHTMSRRATAFDEAVVGSLFKTMKIEEGLHSKFASRQQAWLAVFDSIEFQQPGKEAFGILHLLTG